MNDNIKKTEEFMKNELLKAIHFEGNTERSIQYRIEHSYRVANIMKDIAIHEGLNQEKAIIAGLLHDIGYSLTHYKTNEDFRNHGRLGAEIAREFLKTLNYSEYDINEICYGIAIHVDDKSDFEFERTKLAVSVGDADNIDRFDAFRLYETLQNNNYRDMPLEEQKAFCNKYITGLTKFKDVEIATEYGKKLWIEKIDYQINFYKKLLNQADNSKLN